MIDRIKIPDMKMILQISILSMATLFSFSNDKKGKSATTAQTVKNINYKILFHAYNKFHFDKFIWPTSTVKDSLAKILSLLQQRAIEHELDTLGEYYTFYKGTGFVPLSSYVEQAKARKSSLLGSLVAAEKAVKNGQIDKDKLFQVDHYCLLLSSSETFPNDWLISPDYSFSSELIDIVFKNQHELLYNQYLYDNDPESQYHLPIVEKLNLGDETIISPHFIDGKHAAGLIHILDQHKVDHNGSLEKEIKLFKHLLQKVVLGDVILVLNNHSQ